MKMIKLEELEQFIDERLVQMWLRPRMWGDARELQSACLSLLEVSERFAGDVKPRVVMDAYQQLKATIRCPSPLSVADYLTDYDKGPRMRADEAAQTMMDFFLELRSSLKENRHVDQEKA